MKDIRKEKSERIDEKRRIQSILSKYLQFKYMEEDAENWIKMENNTKMYVPVNYAYYFVQYQNMYFSDVYDDFIDISPCCMNANNTHSSFPKSPACSNIDGANINPKHPYTFLF